MPDQTTPQYDLDLDLLQPQPRKVKLGDKLYDVYPPKVKDIANLARLAGQLQAATGDNVQEKVGELIDAFGKIMPDLKSDPDVDLSLPQLMALFGFVNTMVSPTDNSELKAAGIEPDVEKKIPPVS